MKRQMTIASTTNVRMVQVVLAIQPDTHAYVERDIQEDSVKTISTSAPRTPVFMAIALTWPMAITVFAMMGTRERTVAKMSMIAILGMSILIIIFTQLICKAKNVIHKKCVRSAIEFQQKKC